MFIWHLTLNIRRFFHTVVIFLTICSPSVVLFWYLLAIFDELWNTENMCNCYKGYFMFVEPVKCGGAKGMVSGWTTLKNLELFWIFTLLMSKLFRNLSPYILFCLNLKIHLHVKQWFYFLWEMLRCNNLQTFKEAWYQPLRYTVRKILWDGVFKA